MLFSPGVERFFIYWMFFKRISIYLSIYLRLFLSIYLSIYLSIFLYACLRYSLLNLYWTSTYQQILYTSIPYTNRIFHRKHILDIQYITLSLDSYIWNDRSWPSSEFLHSPALWGHCMLSSKPTEVIAVRNGWWEKIKEIRAISTDGL